MKIKQSEFIISAVKPEQYPEEPYPDIAFAGRSNVGKSSLINMLLGRKNLARTSSTPGKTQTINFYEIDNKFRFVDFPGYGYAKVSKSQFRTWGKIIQTYIDRSENLLEVIQLVDIRHKPTELDRQMYEWIMEAGFNGIIVATKADKLSKSQQNKQIEIKEPSRPKMAWSFQYRQQIEPTSTKSGT
jgi:GTP-binding protein